MSLARVGPQTDGIKPRHLETPWAKEGSMEGFPWKLLVRRWRIDVFTERSVKTPLGEGENVALEEVMMAPIIPEWVDLKLAVSDHELVVDLDFHREVIFEQSTQLKDLRLKVDDLERDLMSPTRRKDTGERLGKLKKEIQLIDPKDKQYQMMSKNYGSELSLVIALVIDDQTVIDLARIGIFATPDP
jgi:hypothetical protein